MMFNGSGYNDPTAFKAIVNVQKEERRNMAAHGYADGDIVVVDTPGGEMEVLLLKCHMAYATGLKLATSRPEENCMAVRSKQMMYCDTGRFVYAFYDKIVSLVRTLGDEEYESVRDEVAKTMGFRIQEAGVVLQSQEAQLPEIDYDAIGQSVRDAFAHDLHVRDDFIRVSAERDVYKKLFEELMEKGAGK